jgi:hypothetical protein
MVRTKIYCKKISKVIKVVDLVLAENKLLLCTLSVRILIKLCDPLQITIHVPIERESQGVLAPALQGRLHYCIVRG